MQWNVLANYFSKKESFPLIENIFLEDSYRAQLFDKILINDLLEKHKVVNLTRLKPKLGGEGGMMILFLHKDICQEVKDFSKQLLENNPLSWATDVAVRSYLYNNFDAMVLPRRYAGLCLPMNEALISAMPVFMTNVSPNNEILPKEWLVDSEKIGKFNTKTMVNIYEAYPDKLAKLIDDYISNDKVKIKEEAVKIGFNNFSVEVLKDKWLNIINE